MLDKETKAETNRSFSQDSPFARILRETEQHPQLRQSLIEKLESEFDAKVVTFFTSFVRPEGAIADVDAEIIESILAEEGRSHHRLVLIINSPGGQALAAERIVNVCRAYPRDSFEVLVPHMAKSAATLICFGANRIHMSPTAELGPVDPQLPYFDDKGNHSVISADEYIRSYEQLMNEATEGVKKRIEPYLQQLNRYDSRLVEQLRSAQKLSKDISVRLLKSSMMKDKSDTDIKEKIRVFLTQEATSAHGRMITMQEVLECDLNVKEIDLQSDLWKLVWELYVRSNWAVSKKGVKLVESASSSTMAS